MTQAIKTVNLPQARSSLPLANTQITLNIPRLDVRTTSRPIKTWFVNRFTETELYILARLHRYANTGVKSMFLTHQFAIFQVRLFHIIHLTKLLVRESPTDWRYRH
jgi:hypothetical protein